MSLTVDEYYKAISSETADNDEALIAMASDEPNGVKATFAITPWTNYTLKIVPSDSKTRLIVFKPPKDRQKFGCIRVRDKNNTKTKLWDVVEQAGHYVGLVPAGCIFEAMMVDAKIFTRQ